MSSDSRDSASRLVTPAMSKGDSYKLNCLIEGEFIVFLVTVEKDYAVDEFKRVIQDMRQQETLKDVDPPTLELWKVSAIEALQYEVTSLFSAQGLYRCGASQHSGSTYWAPWR